MRRALLAILLVATLAPAAGRGAPAAAKKALGALDLKAWGPRKDVYFERVQLWRQGCDLVYRFTYQRQKDHELKLRLILQLDAGPASSATPFTVSRQAGAQVGKGRIPTPNCWIKKARHIKRASFEAVGDPPRAAPKDGRIFLGRVTFNRWGSSGDVYYRHIRTWKKNCQIHYQFLYKRRTAARRRLRMKLTVDQHEVHTPWVRSKTRGWREIVGSVSTPDCWAAQARSLRTAGFESERY